MTTTQLPQDPNLYGDPDDPGTAMSHEVPWYRDQFGTSTGVRVLLTCGHYAMPVHECSSDFDFPSEAHTCPAGCGERQYHLAVQAVLLEDRF